MNDTPKPNLVETLYALLVTVCNHLQSPFLLVIRVFWGVMFAQTGYGKLGSIPKVTDFFASLHIPFPMANAYFVGCVEFFGGILLTIGFLTRPASFFLAATLVVAYITSEQPALKALFSGTDTDPFVKADPFAFLFATLVVLLFGPGAYSIDFLVGRKRASGWRSSNI